jgi:hypothetical protein
VKKAHKKGTARKKRRELTERREKTADIAKAFKSAAKKK